MAHVAAQIQLGENALKGIGLVGNPFRHGLSDLGGELCEGICGQHTVAECESVHVEADLVLEVGVIPARYGTADGDILLSGIPVKERLHKSQQRHVEAGTKVSRYPLQRRRGIAIEVGKYGIAGECLDRGPEEVCGKIEWLEVAGEFCQPVPAVAIDIRILQLLILPGGEVFVLQQLGGQR